jgi:hypothetical protein
MPILDVAIGTIFVFLLFSLVISALNELILSLFDNRAKFLQMGLNELLHQAKVSTVADAKKSVIFFSSVLRYTGLPALWKAFFVRSQPNEWTKAICNHGLVNALSRPGGRVGFPSYIPTGAFVTALLDMIARGQWSTKADGTAQPSGDVVAMNTESLIASISNLPEGKLRQSLLSLISATGGELTAFETALEGWFNSSMDRVSGWYKNFAHKWMILLGFMVAAAVNVDSINIIHVLSTNPNLAKAVASQAEAYWKSEPPPQTAEQKQPARDAEIAAAKKELADAQSAKDKEKEAAAQKRLAAATAPASIEEARAAFQRSVTRLGETGIPIGWSRDQLKALNLEGRTFTATSLWQKRGRILPWISEHCGQLFLLLAGWTLTAIAGSLGASFWFDLLGRFVNIRNNGKAPADKDPTQPGGAQAAPSLNRAPLLSNPVSRSAQSLLTTGDLP